MNIHPSAAIRQNYNEIADMCRKTAKRYMIIFQNVDDIVYADYIVDCRQDYGWLIR